MIPEIPIQCRGFLRDTHCPECKSRILLEDPPTCECGAPVEEKDLIPCKEQTIIAALTPCPLCHYPAPSWEETDPED